MAMLLITHDMGVIAGHADRVNVMYAGRVVETTEVGRAVQPDAPPVHPGPARVDSPAQPGQREGAARHPRPASGPGQPASGLPVRAALHAGDGQVPRQEPPLAGDRPAHLFSCWHPVDGPLVLEVVQAAAPDAASIGLAAPVTGAAQGPVPDVPLAVTELPPGPAATADDAKPLLELRHLVKEFPVRSGAILQRKVGAVHAVSDVSFSVPAGTTFGLVGESGCGKTTIGKMIVALERPDSGVDRAWRRGRDRAARHRAAPHPP